MATISEWSDLLLEASRRDFTDGFPNGQQSGPTRTSRAMAIAHLAILDAHRVFVAPTKTYLKLKHGVTLSLPAGLVQADVIDGAAHRAMTRMYPADIALFQTGVGAVDRASFEFGESIAQQLLNFRANDGAANNFDFAYSGSYGAHGPDPFASAQRSLTPHWGNVARFGLNARVALDPFPGYDTANHLSDADYRKDFEEVVEFGAREPRKRTADEQAIGLYWGYDGANGIGVPPRLYNQVARGVAVQRGLNDADTIVMLAMVNMAMADSGIDAWHWKYHYDLWRPIVGVRNEATSIGGDPFWTPLGAPQTNRKGASPGTPGFPAYPSGHATFGAALFQVLQLFASQPAITVKNVLDAEKNPAAPGAQAFTFVSDELDGKAIDVDGSVRTRVERTYPNYAKAVSENSLSRVYLGVHWRFDGVPRKQNNNIGGVPLGLTIGKQSYDFLK